MEESTNSGNQVDLVSTASEGTYLKTQSQTPKIHHVWVVHVGTRIVGQSGAILSNLSARLFSISPMNAARVPMIVRNPERNSFAG